MSDGSKIIITIGNLPFVPGTHDRGDERRSSEESPGEFHPRENGANTFNRHARNNSAADLRNSLLALLDHPDGKSTIQPQTNRTDYSQNSTDSNKFTNSADSTNANSYNFTNGRSNETSGRNSSQNLVNKTLEELIDVAQQHTDFSDFSDKSTKFWDRVQQMSDISVVEKYVDGNLEPQAYSRYGEILSKFTRQGGDLNSFLTMLPPSEREVFQARFLLDQTFGTNELFVGRGIAIDKSGQFVVREFLANNGKQIETPLSTVLGFLGGKLSENSAASLFANGQLLLNAKTAALLSLSLALYQNIDAKMLLTEALPESTPQNLLGKTNENGGTRYVENHLEGAKINIDRRSGEYLIVAALINGAFTVVDKREQANGVRVNARSGGETVIGNPFAAGAMGAMFGAVVGCVVPLSETSIGTALNFAASVVVGTSERGLRSLSSTLLISDVITNGVQKFLNAGATALPAERIDPRDLLKQQLFNHRRLAYLAS